MCCVCEFVACRHVPFQNYEKGTITSANRTSVLLTSLNIAARVNHFTAEVNRRRNMCRQRLNHDHAAEQVFVVGKCRQEAVGADVTHHVTINADQSQHGSRSYARRLALVFGDCNTIMDGICSGSNKDRLIDL